MIQSFEVAQDWLAIRAAARLPSSEIQPVQPRVATIHPSAHLSPLHALAQPPSAESSRVSFHKKLERHIARKAHIWRLSYPLVSEIAASGTVRCFFCKAVCIAFSSGTKIYLTSMFTGSVKRISCSFPVAVAVY